MDIEKIQKISNWAAVIGVIIFLLFIGGYTTCKLSEGTMLPNFKCVDMNQLEYCIFEDHIYKYNKPPIDLNITLNET